jgi:hypothetical protein
MVNNDELIRITEELILQSRYRINRCRYKRVRLYIKIYEDHNPAFRYERVAFFVLNGLRGKHFPN